ncbi:MAG: methyltransferase, partial [Candidatus Aenigmarchaeota archaeon]|nr:methyltransferase [Candidatus Aenigmarchaeota archaeon]
LKTELTTLLKKLKREGKSIVGYGAAAKGTVLLNYFKIGPELVTYVVDKNPLKQGMYIPGMKMPVYGPQKLMEDKPDYVLLLVWNIAEEVMKEQSAFAKAGGKFIIPIPKPKIV